MTLDRRPTLTLAVPSQTFLSLVSDLTRLMAATPASRRRPAALARRLTCGGPVLGLIEIAPDAFEVGTVELGAGTCWRS